MQKLNTSEHNRLQSILLFSLGLFIALLFAIYLAQGIWKRAAVAPSQLATYKQVPDFSLTERSGHTVTLQDLKGHVWVANFIFTSCPSTCATLSMRMRELQQALRRNPEVKLVSFTVDPEYDTPEVLAQYAQRYMASPEQWLFFTGQPEQIYQVAQKGFLLGFMQNPQAEQPTLGRYSHSTKFAIIDAQGVVRAYHDGMSEYVVREILDDVMSLLRQPTPISPVPQP